jgi:hypothetical protein
MADNRLTLDQLAALLSERGNRLHARNLILVALPLATAERQARELAGHLKARYIDFDCQLLDQMAADGRDDHVALEQRGTLSIGQMLAEKWLKEDVRPQITPDQLLVIGNINLAVRYNIDLAAILYDATEQGVCVIVAGGRVQGQTLLIHGTHPQTGASSPAYEVVSLAAGPSVTDSPDSVQERLL